jgi:hypothetical protein
MHFCSRPLTLTRDFAGISNEKALGQELMVSIINQNKSPDFSLLRSLWVLSGHILPFFLPLTAMKIVASPDLTFFMKEKVPCCE